MGYKSIDGLMRHLRNSGISISGSKQKRQLLNTGYYHGYKGYRFFKESHNRLPFSTYDDIYATIQYDSKLKSLFYSKILYIETAVRNIVLNTVISEAKSEDIQTIIDKVVCSYHNSPDNATTAQRRKFQEDKLELQSKIQTYLSKAYKKETPVITHFYNKNNSSNVPIWAFFEIINMGDLGKFISCLIYPVRDKISNQLSLKVSYDTDRQLVYKYIYLLKDLRNAVAHNAVVFDTRFREFDPNPSMKRCLVQEIGLSFVNFKSIEDYVMLMCFYLKALEVPKGEIRSFIRDFEKIVDDYKKSVSSSVASMVVRNDLHDRISVLNNYI